jgi:hypothetical protein
MDQSEAQAILTGHLEPYRRRSYGDLLALMGDVHVIEVVGPSGVKYQIELEVVWDSPREKASVRVLGAIYDGRLPESMVPVGESFIVTPDGTLL